MAESTIQLLLETDAAHLGAAELTGFTASPTESVGELLERIHRSWQLGSPSKDSGTELELEFSGEPLPHGCTLHDACVREVALACWVTWC